MNEVLAEILKSGEARDGNSVVKVHSHITEEEGRFLATLIADSKPNATLEIGLAYGVSAMFICDALSASGSRDWHHTVIDPSQHDPRQSWRGIGLANLRKAGYSDRVEFIEKTSQAALPELAAAGRKFDFAFIDGWHTFDHTLVDFFFTDQLLNVGGIVVIDDINMPPVRPVARFIAANRAYRVLGCAGECEIGWKRRLFRRTFGRAFGRIVRSEFTAFDDRHGISGTCIGLKKLGNDERPWDDFRPF